MRLIPVLGALAAAFVVLDLLSSITTAPACRCMARLLWFIPDLRPFTSAWINNVIGVFNLVFVWVVLSLVMLGVSSALTGGLFGGRILAALTDAIVRKLIAVVVFGVLLHYLVLSIVAQCPRICG